MSTLSTVKGGCKRVRPLKSHRSAGNIRTVCASIVRDWPLVDRERGHERDISRSFGPVDRMTISPVARHNRRVRLYAVDAHRCWRQRNMVYCRRPDTRYMRWRARSSVRALTGLWRSRVPAGSEASKPIWFRRSSVDRKSVV